jgi:hypothetical protein
VDPYSQRLANARDPRLGKETVFDMGGMKFLDGSVNGEWISAMDGTHQDLPVVGGERLSVHCRGPYQVMHEPDLDLANCVYETIRHDQDGLTMSPSRRPSVFAYNASISNDSSSAPAVPAPNRASDDAAGMPVQPT